MTRAIGTPAFMAPELFSTEEDEEEEEKEEDNKKGEDGDEGEGAVAAPKKTVLFPEKTDGKEVVNVYVAPMHASVTAV